MNSQAVRFRDQIVHIQTVKIKGIECLCLDDVQQRFPTVTVFSHNNVQIAFLRDDQGQQLQPLRIGIHQDQIIDAHEPIGRDDNKTLARIDQKIHEMDKKTDLILANTQETLVRIKHVMNLMYELNEFTTPRYFFVLPTKLYQWSSINNVHNWFQLSYKLYFLCECSNDPGKLHIAPHDGYTIKKMTEFVATYGSYLRTTLNIARSLLSVGGFVISQSVNFVGHAIPVCIQEPNQYAEVDNKLNVVEKMLDHHDQLVVPVDSSTMQNLVLPHAPLQGAQLRELEAFLEHVDQTHSLGNLYRTTTDDGHVRWVCLEHYNTLGFNNKMSEYVRQCESMGGKYDSNKKELVLTGNLTSKNVSMITEALTKGFAVIIFVLDQCVIDRPDLDRLFHTIINRSSIHRLILNSVQVMKWMRTTKYVCDRMIVNLTNQSLSVRYNHGDQGGTTRALRRLLLQNQICRSLEFSGLDLPSDDRILISCLKTEVTMSSLIIDQPISEEFLRNILENHATLTRLKLRFSFHLSSQIYHLCQAIEKNRSLVELDMIDQIRVDDKTGLIELLNILQKHSSIRHVHLHLSDLQSSTSLETSLITSLKDYSFITHLRLSESIVSHRLTDALLHACEQRRVLSYLELFHCQIDQDDQSSLELSHASENLLHLLISDQSFWSTVLLDIQRQIKDGNEKKSSSQQIFVSTHRFLLNFHLEFPPYQNETLRKKIDQSCSDSAIYLDQMNLIDQDMNIIVKQVIEGKRCQSLSLQNNRLSFIGLSILSEALRENSSSLTTLYLNGNQIFDDGIRCLVESLSTMNKSLKTLFLEKNRISNRGVKYLADMLMTNSTLLCLYLADNDIEDEGIRILVEVLTNTNKTLETLNLSANSMVTDKSLSYLISMMQRNQTLKTLSIGNCRLSSEGKQALIDIQKGKKDFEIHV